MPEFRDLPSVHEIVERIDSPLPRDVVVGEVRRAVAVARAALKDGREVEVETEARRSLEALARPSLRRVINATGVVLHTNLGRAPSGPIAVLPGYSNLEYDVAVGRRGKRDVHAGALLERLLGVPSIAVNNNAAAVFLALHDLAAGYEVIVSRGELIEIGDGFRIPEIMARSGAILREVGTTNRTSVADYRDAINDRTRLLLRVHPSNFRITGFTARPELREIAGLGRERGIPVYEDLGSGCLVDLRPCGIDEPLATESLRAGIDLISFSGDKLLGGPQAGILAGRAELVSRLRRNPLFRVLRLDKIILQALEATLRSVLFQEWDRIPALRLIRLGAEEIRARAERIANRLPGAEVIPGESMIGGGATPDQSLPTFLIAWTPKDVIETERRLRTGEPPVVARVENDRILLDLRTVLPEEDDELAAVLDGTYVKKQR